MKYNGYGVCRAELRSETLAHKAKRLLSASAIPCEVVRLNGSKSHGCSYGIEIPCNQKNNAQVLLSSDGITVRQWKQGD